MKVQCLQIQAKPAGSLWVRRALRPCASPVVVTWLNRTSPFPRSRLFFSLPISSGRIYLRMKRAASRVATRSEIPADRSARSAVRFGDRDGTARWENPPNGSTPTCAQFACMYREQNHLHTALWQIWRSEPSPPHTHTLPYVKFILYVAILVPQTSARVGH